MKKLITIIVLSFGLSGVAMADDANRSVVNEKTYTFKESFSAFAEIPGKLGNHISLEIEKTKEFQKKNWADMKAQISTLISKFSKNND